MFFWRFCECRRKEHIIIPPWSDCSSSIATQPLGGIGNPGSRAVIVYNALICTTFFQIGVRIFQSCVLGLEPDEVGSDNFIKN